MFDRGSLQWQAPARTQLFFQWWWAEYVAALVFLFWLAGETREAFEVAREGREEKDDDV